MTRPFLRIILHFSQMGFTDGFTFIEFTSIQPGLRRPAGNSSYFDLHVILPLVRSYGDICTVTLSPGSILIKFILSFPEICANILCPPCISTVNMALGSDSMTVPSSSITSSFAKLNYPRFPRFYGTLNGTPARSCVIHCLTQSCQSEFFGLRQDKDFQDRRSS